MNQVPDHAHCEMCGRAIKVGDPLCNDKACFDKKEELQASKKKQIYLFIAMIVAAVLLSKFVQI